MANRNLSGKRIKLARVNREMAQIELCAALSVDHGVEMTQNTLSNIERGQRIVSDTELVAFSETLDVSPLWLLFGEKVPKFSDKPLRGK